LQHDASSSPSRETLRAHRQIFWGAWQKSQANLPLHALEVRIARVIHLHPEYHSLFNDRESFLDRDFQEDGGMNPYLHLSLHIALEEQIATHQPPEVSNTLEYLMQTRHLDRHDALHRILDVLTETLHAAQQTGNEPDTQAYAARIKGLRQS